MKFLSFDIKIILDLLAATGLLYGVYKTTKGEIALKVLVGFLGLLIMHRSVEAIHMKLSNAILSLFMQQGALVMIILFQREIKRLCFIIGDTIVQTSQQLIATFVYRVKVDYEMAESITAMVEATKTLAGSNTGTLLVISNTDSLQSYKESGEIIDATISKRLLLAIFDKKSPLHDGGVIIYNQKILSARSILPVTERQDIPQHLGLRHRAAIGMTEVTDTLVVVVSEETGQISVANKGYLNQNVTVQETRAAINNYLQNKRRK